MVVQTKLSLSPIFLHFLIIIFRMTETGRIQKLLLEGDKMRRKRENRVNIQVQFVSWIVEFVAFWIVTIPQVKLGANEIFGLLYTLFYFVLTPLTYLLNNTITKQIIILGNWGTGLTVFFGLMPPPPEPEPPSASQQPRRKKQATSVPDNVERATSKKAPKPRKEDGPKMAMKLCRPKKVVKPRDVAVKKVRNRKKPSKNPRAKANVLVCRKASEPTGSKLSIHSTHCGRNSKDAW